MEFPSCLTSICIVTAASCATALYTGGSFFLRDDDAGVAGFFDADLGVAVVVDAAADSEGDLADFGFAMGFGVLLI